MKSGWWPLPLGVAGLVALMTMAQANANAQTNGEPGKAILKARCTACHAATVVTSQRRSRDRWRATVDQMIGRGAKIGDDEYDVLIEYLTRLPARI